MTKQTSETVHIGKYADVLSDRWFKRIFGWAPAKRLMQLFLSELIPEREIADISFGPQEHINPIDEGKDIRLDVQCTDSNGDLFLVEVQVADQASFYDRAVFNSSMVIQEQLPPGSTTWDFGPIYFIGIMNFSRHIDSDQVLFRYSLRENTSGELMTDSIQYIFLELPNCIKAFTPSATPLDNLCYVLRNLSTFTDRPQGLEGELYDLLFSSTEISKFAPKERKEYYKYMTTKKDIANQIAFAYDKGIKDDRITIARKMLADGVAIPAICKYTGLTQEEVEALTAK